MEKAERNTCIDIISCAQAQNHNLTPHEQIIPTTAIQLNHTHIKLQRKQNQRKNSKRSNMRPWFLSHLISLAFSRIHRSIHHWPGSWNCTLHCVIALWRWYQRRQSSTVSSSVGLIGCWLQQMRGSCALGPVGLLMQSHTHTHTHTLSTSTSKWSHTVHFYCFS